MKKVFIILILLLSLTGCNKKEDNEITYFKYTYGSPMGLYYEYEIKYDDNNQLMLHYYNYKGSDGIVELMVTKYNLKEINEIIKENNIDKWNGFNKQNENVLDGSGFDLEIHYSDDTSIKAHGYMIYPENYETSSKPLKEYLNFLVK